MIDIEDEDFEELYKYGIPLERWLGNRNGNKSKRNGIKIRPKDDEKNRKRGKRRPDKDNSR